MHQGKRSFLSSSTLSTINHGNRQDTGLHGACVWPTMAGFMMYGFMK